VYVPTAIRFSGQKRKTIHNNLPELPRCFNEIKTLEQCQNVDNILNMHEFYEDADKYYLITDFIEGGNLFDRLTPEDKPLTEYEAASIIRDLARALTFLHSHGIAHRDIKPQNILVKSRKTLSPCVIADFDLSYAECNSNACSDYQDHCGSSPSSPDQYGDKWRNGSERQPKSNGRSFPMEMESPVGSPEYMSPEVARIFLEDEDYTTEKYSEACDIWSLGILLFKLLCGDVPFKAHGCGYDDCQWEEGYPCDDCQISLWEEICNADLVFRSSEWKYITEQARHLVTACLTADARDRIPAAEILNHPFIRALDNIQNPVNDEIDDLSTTMINNCAVIDRMTDSPINEDPKYSCDDFVNILKDSQQFPKLQLNRFQVVELHAIENYGLIVDLQDNDSGSCV